MGMSTFLMRVDTVYRAHMGKAEELETIIKTSTYNGTRMLSVDNYVLEAVCYAGPNIFKYQSPSESLVG